ncbi:MAG TPA: hypothetical protein VGR63_19195 [Casimicrobiaceae bacterium]|jgi:hypothetical protein|nr:hypothetical protein [Casimicrobiaceae bacterium]
MMPEDQSLSGEGAAPAPEMAAPAPDAPRGSLMTAEMAARLLMKSAERIRQLSREGWIPKHGTGANTRYALVDVVQGYIRFRDDVEKRQTKTAAATRISDARAREIELRTAIREGRLIDLDEALEAVEDLVGLLRSELSGLPARCTRDLQLRRTIETARNDILDRIADLATQKAAAMGARRDHGAAIEADATGRMGGGEPHASADIGGAGAA